jgi:DNA-binding transcriptional MerR regulator
MVDYVYEQNLLGEQVFFSKDAAQIAGISLRQLQWWDERKVISPQQQDHRRTYSYQQLLEVFVVAALRRKGMSLQNVRRVLRPLRLELARRIKANVIVGQSALYILSDGKSVYLEEQPSTILRRLADAKTGMYLVSLSDLIRATASKKAPRYYLTTQLPLFEGQNKKRGTQ